MSKPCTHCGASLPDDAVFCPTCGKAATPPKAAASEPVMDTAPAPEAAPAAEPSPAPAPEVIPAGPSEPPPPLTVSPVGYASPADMGVPAAPAAGGASALKWVVGGCAAIGCLGAVLLAAVIGYFSLRPGPLPGPGVPPGQIGANTPLAQVVPRQVGDGRFTLTETKPFSGPQYAAATDGVLASYSDAQSTQAGVGHILMRFPTDEQAAQTLRSEMEQNRAQGYTVVQETPLIIGQEQVGTIVVMRGTNETVLWTNGPLFAVAAGTAGAATAFQKAVPY